MPPSRGMRAWGAGGMWQQGQPDATSLPLLSTRPGAGWGQQPPSCRLDTKPGVGFPRSQPCLLGLTVPQLSR